MACTFNVYGQTLLCKLPFIAQSNYDKLLFQLLFFERQYVFMIIQMRKVLFFDFDTIENTWFDSGHRLQCARMPCMQNFQNFEFIQCSLHFLILKKASIMVVLAVYPIKGDKVVIREQTGGRTKTMRRETFLTDNLCIKCQNFESTSHMAFPFKKKHSLVGG